MEILKLGVFNLKYSDYIELSLDGDNYVTRDMFGQKHIFEPLEISITEDEIIYTYHNQVEDAYLSINDEEGYYYILDVQGNRIKRKITDGFILNCIKKDNSYINGNIYEVTSEHCYSIILAQAGFGNLKMGKHGLTSVYNTMYKKLGYESLEKGILYTFD